jgi:hypothetical protein
VSATLTPALRRGARSLRLLIETPFEGADVELEVPQP